MPNKSGVPIAESERPGNLSAGKVEGTLNAVQLTPRSPKIVQNGFAFRCPLMGPGIIGILNFPKDRLRFDCLTSAIEKFGK